MRSTHHQRSMKLAAAIAAVVLIAGCSLRARQLVRQATYPPNFNYISEQELETTMGKLASGVKRLERLMGDPSLTEERRQTETIETLTHMHEATTKLGPGAWPSNHPVVRDNLDDFLNELVLARRAVQARPPNYYLAGSISGACLHCHGKGL